MNKIDMIKGTSMLMGNIGVGKIVSSVISKNVKTNNVLSAVCVGIAGFGISAAIGDQVNKAIDTAIDDIVNIIYTTTNKNVNNQ